MPLTLTLLRPRIVKRQRIPPHILTSKANHTHPAASSPLYAIGYEIRGCRSIPSPERLANAVPSRSHTEYCSNIKPFLVHNDPLICGILLQSVLVFSDLYFVLAHSEPFYVASVV